MSNVLANKYDIVKMQHIFFKFYLIFIQQMTHKNIK